MAPLPKRRHSTRRGGKRQAAIKLKIFGLMKCPNCGSIRIAHRACKQCGWYDGKVAIPQKVEKTKKK
ncbi:50S ribosomal protein L32 [Candidatus Gottesmanbacteria bacterium]|nr:50S ribosomal protein L32 [Candidatus Gottesmanbacteria bacterium]